MKYAKYLMLVTATILSACGGGGGGGSAPPPVSAPPPPPPAAALSGQFKDANTEGLSYATASGSGTTNAMGAFNYRPGETVQFSVGGVAIGSAVGQSILTPVDLVPGGASNDTEVRNIARFLLMLDHNDDPSDGIRISAAVQQAAANWSQVNFAAGDFNNEVVTIVSDVASVDSRAAALPENQVAQAHLELTARCAMSGYFEGTLTGPRGSTITLLVNPLHGMVTATYPGAATNLESTAGVTVDAMRSFVITALDDSGDNFEGRFDTYDEVSGVWTIGSDTGQFTASRKLPDPTAVYRFTGQTFRNVVGTRLVLPMVLNVDAQGNLTGASTDVISGNTYSASGTFDGQDFDYSWLGVGSRTGTVDAKLFVQGSGSNGAGDSRPWIAQGCRLN